MRCALLLVLLAGCTPIDLVVAELPASADGGKPMMEGPCVDSSDCEADEYCEASTCDAVAGRCQRTPAFCDAALAPRCGCNGVTYWNDCLRRASGVRSSAPGPCPQRCASPSSACADPLARCTVFAGSPFQCNAPASCWVVPPTCPESPRVRPCGPGPGGCVDACVAARSARPHHRASECE